MSDFEGFSKSDIFCSIIAPYILKFAFYALTLSYGIDNTTRSEPTAT